MSEVDWTTLAGAAEPDDLLPDGDYELECLRASHGHTAEHHKLRFSALFAVTEGIYSGRQIWHNFTVSPESDLALMVFFGQMREFGMTKTFFAHPDTAQPDDIVNKLMGSRVQGHVVVGEYLGAPRNGIAWFRGDRSKNTAPRIGAEQG